SYIYIVNSDGTTVEAFNDDACTDQSQVSTFLCEPGTYYIVVDATAPAEQGTFTLQLSEDTSFVFEAEISKEDISCHGETDGTAKVDVTGGVSPFDYAWSVSTSTDDSIFGLSAGEVIVSVTDNDNCVVTDTVEIIEPAPLSVNVTSTDVSCSGANDGTATANVSGGTPNPNFPAPNNYSYTWNTIPQQSLPTAVFLGAGSYSVIVTDDNGCVATGSANISTSTQIIVNTDSLSHVSCFGNADGYIEISANGGVTPYSYEWSNGDSVAIIDSLPPGDYDITVYDADNCFVEEFYTITEPDELELIVNNVFDATCYDEADGVIDISTLGGTFPYDYLWSDNTQTEDLINVFAGDYTLSVFDANNCLDTISATIDQPDSIEINFTKTDPSCFGEEDGSMSVSASGGTPGYDITWSDFNPNPVRNNVGAGLYSVFVRDLNNCFAVDSVRLSTPPEITINDSVIGASCNNATDGAIFIDVNGGVPPYDLDWSDNSTDSNRINIPAGVYTLIVTDQEGCMAEMTAIVEEQGVLYLNLVGTDVRCNGEANGSATAVISGGLDPIDYNWNVPGAPNSDEIRNLEGGTYAVTVTDANGCEAIDSVEISVPPELLLNVDSTQDATCFGDDDGFVQLSATGGVPPYRYSVFTNVFQSSGSFSGLSAGLHGAIVIDSNDCIVQEDFTIGENDPFEFSFEYIYYITRGSSITLEPELIIPADKVLEYSWSPATGLSCTDCRNPDASPLETTNYTVTGVDEDGCIYETSTSVYVKRDHEVFIPNAFSPNGDDVNDEFFALDFGSTDNITIRIFNRTGE
ncbi:MAG: gliding motility-associated C-terminal domain-containing protein, partial [Chitinophagales bacterium]